MNTHWQYPDSTPPDIVRKWANRLGIDPHLAGLLWQRGLESLEAMDEFLLPTLKGLAPLNAWPGFTAAAKIIVDNLDKGKKLLIWGDYDVDGVTGATLMEQVFSFHGIPCQVHLPHRVDEGYGLNSPGLENYAKQGIGLILTVDCGISDVDAVAKAKELGLIVVISDHHLPPENLPAADALCNPRLGESPCPHLAGVGVAFFLMAAVNAELGLRGKERMDMRKTLDIVALGTLADIVPLTGQNRILVKNGLMLLGSARRPGIAALKQVSGYSSSAQISSGQALFNLAPRINAAGRMAEAEAALNLLRAKSLEEAAWLAKTLDEHNSRRRSEEEKILEEALIQAEDEVAHGRMGFVLWGEGWNQGVVGIVASRIVEKFYRPVLILCRDKDAFKGSGRSIAEFDLYEALSSCASLLINFGGHRQAAGLRIAGENLAVLRQAFDQVCRKKLGDKPLIPTLRIDGELDFARASDFDFLKNLEQMQPFGAGNPEPVFASPPLILKKARFFGKDKNHLDLRVTDTTTDITLHAKLWRKADKFPDLPPEARLKLAYMPGFNSYNGITGVELRIKDWQVLE